MKKRLLGTLICIIVALSAIFVVGSVVSFASERPIVSVAEVVAESGEEFNISVSITGNVGIAGVNLSLSYDDTKISPVLEGGRPSFTTTLSGVKSVNCGTGTINYIWANAENFTTDGEIVSFRFQASETAYSETDLVIESLTVYNASENIVDVNTSGAKCYVAELPQTGTQTSAATDGKYAIRFVGKIRTEIKDLLLTDDNSFGFSIKLSGQDVQTTTVKVFTCTVLMHTISGSGHVQSGQEGVDGYEYFALTVYNVPTGYTTAEYSAWININGITFTNDVGAVAIAPVS